MAAAIIPLATALLPAVVPVVVKLVEQVLGPKTGPTKLDVASQILESIQAGLVNTKAIDPQALNTEQIKTLIEAAVTDLKKRGELQGARTALDTTLADIRKRLRDVQAVIDLLAPPN